MTRHPRSLADADNHDPTPFHRGWTRHTSDSRPRCCTVDNNGPSPGLPLVALRLSAGTRPAGKRLAGVHARLVRAGARQAQPPAAHDDANAELLPSTVRLCSAAKIARPPGGGQSPPPRSPPRLGPACPLSKVIRKRSNAGGRQATSGAGCCPPRLPLAAARCASPRSGEAPRAFPPTSIPSDAGGFPLPKPRFPHENGRFPRSNHTSPRAYGATKHPYGATKRPYGASPRPSQGPPRTNQDAPQTSQDTPQTCQPIPRPSQP